MTDETGTGSLVFNTSPTLNNASLNTSTLNNCTVLNKIFVNVNGVLVECSGIVNDSLFNTSPPTSSNDSAQGFVVGSRWHMLNGDRYICRDNTASSAVWKKYAHNAAIAVIEGYSNLDNTILADGGLLTVRKNSINDVYISNNQICNSLVINAANFSADTINFSTLPLLQALSIYDLNNLETINLTANIDVAAIHLENLSDLNLFLTPEVTNLTSLTIINCPAIDFDTLNMGTGDLGKYDYLSDLIVDGVSNSMGDPFSLDSVPAATSITFKNVTNLPFYGMVESYHPVQQLYIERCYGVSTLPFAYLTSLSSLTWRGEDPMNRLGILSIYDLDLTIATNLDMQFSSIDSISTINLPTTLTHWDLTGSYLGSNTVLSAAPSVTHLTLDGAEVASTQTFDLTQTVFDSVTHLSADGAIGLFASTGGLTDGMTGLLDLDLSNSNIAIDLTNNTALTHLHLSDWAGNDLVNANGNPNTDTLVNLIHMNVAYSSSITSLDVSNNVLLTFLNASGCAVSNVDTILIDIDTAGLSDGFLDLSGGTNAAPTGGASNAEVLSLQGKGWTVNHN